MSTQNTKELSELLNWLFDWVDSILGALSGDGKITLIDAPLFFKTLLSSTAAIQGINKIPQELATMSNEEAAFIKNKIKERFNYVEDSQIELIYESLIIHGVGIARNLVRLYTPAA